MFFDWVGCYQDFDFELPIISDDGFAHFDFVDGVFSKVKQRRIQHEGSFSTSISIHVQGNRLVVDGNPSRYGRLDNLFGFSNLDDCFAVYNHILKSLGLPVFTKCLKVGFIDALDGKAPKLVADGAVLSRLDITTNMAVGKNCIPAYFKALSMMSYRRSKGFLFPNGKTVEWKSILGNAKYIYPSVYDKEYEYTLHLLPRIKKDFGVESSEFIYIQNLINYCRDLGVTRYEQKIKSPFLLANNLHYWGLSDHTKLIEIHNEFLNIDRKLKVSAMDLRTISETLREEGICENVKAANATACYAYNWMNGEKFDETKSQVKIHRARLRKIGIDILMPCNLLLFSPVIIKEVIEITRQELQPPSFYKFAQLPNPLRLVA